MEAGELTSMIVTVVRLGLPRLLSVPDKLSALIQTLPPDPPPERLLVPFAPLAQIEPLTMTLPPAAISIEPPPAAPPPA